MAVAPTFDTAIAQTRAAFIAALERGDAPGATSVYADDGRLLPPGSGLVRGREAITAFWKAGIEAGISGAEFETLEISLHDHIGFEIGRYALQLKPVNGAIVVDRGNYLFVHARQDDGSWRRAVEMFTPDLGSSH